ncbi:MAG TPA: hypothetical protein PL017_09155 [Tenuifilaceae bacterium]|nr:hypothetical protein [Tenuifilaceae bacterium]HPE18464.1 hypothetical protein [Tenuifilaceae bacterium]HPJ46253.1 hypothetical protein [Tenuifilaceae bacterium]HPQ34330.1 hypothetical protein [Tenuifilaceae bacterium]HRX69393.1 hypothetical protein [Tenuifilaceae bacterium]
MKKTVVVLLTALAPLLSMGQSSLGKTDDLGRIALAAIVPDAAEIPKNASKMLQNKMQQIATQNGLGASEQSQFAIVPIVTIVSKEVTPTAPPMQALNLDITLYIVDGQSQNIFSQTTISTKGVGKTEDAAYVQGIKQLNAKHGQFKGFVEKGKEKIIEYYNSQCDVIIKGSQALAGQQKYEEALYMLLSVPDISRECYDKCMDFSIDIYKQFADQKCSEYLSAAKAAWAGKELSSVEENLAKITPDMACYPEAQQLVEQVTAAVEAEGGKAWEYKMKVYDNTVEKEKMMIQAGKEVAMQWAHWGAAKHFNWDWRFLYPNAEPPKQVETKKTESKTTSKPKEEKVTKSEPLENPVLLPAKVSAHAGTFKGNYNQITDGIIAQNGQAWDGETCVSWSGFCSFTLDLGSIHEVTGIIVSLDNNDSYQIDWSQDGSSFQKLTIIDKTFGIDAWGMDTFSTLKGHESFISQVSFQPVKARFLKIYATEGDDSYSVSELQIFGY